MELLRFWIKLPFAIFFITLPVLIGILVQWLPFAEKTKVLVSSYITFVASKFVLPIMGIKVRIQVSGNWKPQSPALIVSNHLSYIDPLLIGRKFKSLFITSMETAETSIEGTICKACGCIFIERRNRDRVNEEIASVAGYLKNGHDVVLFAEATSTDGSRVLPFKMSFFESAIQAQVPIQPISISIEKINGESVNEKNRDQICYYGDMKFSSHLMNFLKLRSAEIRIDILPQLWVQATDDRKSLSERTFEQISSSYQAISKG